MHCQALDSWMHISLQIVMLNSLHRLCFSPKWVTVLLVIMEPSVVTLKACSGSWRQFRNCIATVKLCSCTECIYLMYLLFSYIRYFITLFEHFSTTFCIGWWHSTLCIALINVFGWMYMVGWERAAIIFIVLRESRSFFGGSVIQKLRGRCRFCLILFWP